MSISARTRQSTWSTDAPEASVARNLGICLIGGLPHGRRAWLASGRVVQCVGESRYFDDAVTPDPASFGGEAERTIGQPSPPGGSRYSAGAADPTGKTKPGLRSLAPSLLGSSEVRRHRA
jgi:hypothetical protein